MLIASVSDIHTDFLENREAVVKLACAIHDRQADVVIIAGDISNKEERIDRGLRAFSEVAKHVLFVPGNHDLWFDGPFADLDTWQRYRVQLKEIAEGAGAHYLPSAPFVLENVAIVGTCGWYDYSLALPSLRESVGEETFSKKQYAGVSWSDSRFIAFRDENGALLSDGQVAKQMERELEQQLAEVEADPVVELVVAVSHHQPFDEVVSRTGTVTWEYFNAFMGSVGLGQVIRQHRKVAAVIYGHSHRVGSFVIDDRRVYGTPLGYPRERIGLSDEEMLATRIGWIDTGDLSRKRSKVSNEVG